MTLDEFHKYIKQRFPEVSERADVLYDDYWNSLVKVEFSAYSWFESLANAINSDMRKQVNSDQYIDLFEHVRHSYMVGDEDTKKTVDVAFVENLFWNVPREESKHYWHMLPELLKELYINFHRKGPL